MGIDDIPSHGSRPTRSGARPRTTTTDWRTTALVGSPDMSGGGLIRYRNTKQASDVIGLAWVT